MAQLYKSKSAFQKPETDNLFSGLWLRWGALTIAERFVCANIVLLPVWWVVGLYQYMSILLLLGVVLYEWRRYGEIRLKRPSLLVFTLFAFCAYLVVKRFFHFTRILGDLEETVILSFFPALWLWYIQSHDVRLRIEVVAWACTVSAVQMIGFWFLLQYVLPETILFPPRPTLFALLTGQKAGGLEAFQADFGLNYLVPYLPRSMFGVNRFSMFFIFPEFFAVVAGFIGIVALDIKNRFWSWLLFLASVFLIFLSATRIVWVAFPLVVVLHYLFKNFGKPWGPPIIFALIAVLSFTTLSIPSATQLVSNTLTDSAQTVDELRENSTDTRLEIYRRTWEGIKENPLWGYGSEGPILASSNVDARVGSHSTILGSLLYQRGLVATVIFIFFWILLLIWFYKTRSGRPLTCFCMWIFYILVSPTMALVYDTPISSLLILLCAAIRRPKLKSAPIKSLLRRSRYA